MSIQAAGRGRTTSPVPRPAGPAAGATRDQPRDGSAGAGGATPLEAFLGRTWERHRHAADGTVATYIPELGRADPSWFGIAAVTMDGRVLDVGDSRRPFTIQSISKPLTYGLILDDLGEAAVRARIGVEPTGEAFNAITLAPGTGLPLNPMVNAGAIAATGLVRAADGQTPLETLLAGYGRFAGHPLRLDDAVRTSEADTGHRNRAIAQLLRASGAIDGDPEAVVERYFAQCSVAVTAVDLAVIAATLAAGGRNPVTGERALSEASTRAALAVMASCGMYDGAGEWLYAVGLPAKSGVSGAVLMVVPGRLGIAVFSPPLDGNGNSVRGVRVCRDLVRDLDLHPLASEPIGSGAIRATYRLAEVGSKRRRSAAHAAVLADIGRRCLVIELQGTVSFLTPDELAVAIETVRRADTLDHVILDVRRVGSIEPAAVDLLALLVGDLVQAGIEVVISGRYRLAPVVAAMERAMAQVGAGPLATTDDLDGALEVAEERLLATVDAATVGSVSIADQALVRGLSGAGLATVAARLERRIHAAGTMIVERGSPSLELFLIEDGRASVSIELPTGGRRRLSTLGPGMSFGEAALLGGERRSADVRADTDVSCLVLTTAAFDALEAEHPALAAAILRNLLRSVGATAARLTGEVAVLAG